MGYGNCCYRAVRLPMDTILGAGGAAWADAATLRLLPRLWRSHFLGAALGISAGSDTMSAARSGTSAEALAAAPTAAAPATAAEV